MMIRRWIRGSESSSEDDFGSRIWIRRSILGDEASQIQIRRSILGDRASQIQIRRSRSSHDRGQDRIRSSFWTSDPGFEVQISDLGSRISDSGSQISDSGSQISDSGPILDLGCRIRGRIWIRRSISGRDRIPESDFGPRISDSGPQMLDFGVEIGFWSRISVLGCRISGFEHSISVFIPRSGTRNRGSRDPKTAFLSPFRVHFGPSFSLPRGG